MARDGYYGGWPRYVPVAERRAKSAKEAKKMLKNGQKTNPVMIVGRTIASTFWGKAWCQNLESYSDFANRLPRGRTYVRNGSVIDLQIIPGSIQALVMGSLLYKIKISIVPMAQEKWQTLVKQCAGHIDSVVELLQGKFSKAVMTTMTEAKYGLFPKPAEIKLNCSCPDWADMCKHVAAVMYGVGACLDSKPEWLFTLRQVDHLDLIAKAVSLDSFSGIVSDTVIADEDLSDIFGIELVDQSNISERELPKPIVSKQTKRKSSTGPKAKIKPKAIKNIKTKKATSVEAKKAVLKKVAKSPVRKSKTKRIDKNL